MSDSDIGFQEEEIVATSDPSKQVTPLKRLHAWFWRGFLVVSLVAAWYCFYVPSNNIVWADDFATATTQANESGRSLILFFTGDWCVPCRIMKRNVWADQEVASLVNGQFIPVMIDVDTSQDAHLLERYNIRGTPITIIADSQGKALRWRVGGIDKAEFLQLLHDQTEPPKG